MTFVRRTFVALALAIGLGGVPASANAQAFEGIVTVKVRGADMAREAREVQYTMRAGVVRIDMAVRGDTRSVTILDYEAKTTTVVMPRQKKYLVFPMPETTGLRSGQGRHAEIVRTGHKETIAGHECEHWLIKSESGEIDACVASGLGTFTMSGGRGREEAWTGSLREAQGFPLKVSRGGGLTIMEVTKIEPKALDAALFVPPADYQKLEIPAGVPTTATPATLPPPRQRP